MAKEFTDQNFESDVEKNAGVVLVDFWAPWCGPCKVQGPIVEAIAQLYASSPNVTIGKMNVDENPRTGEKYSILSIPTLKIFKAGAIVEDVVGLQSKESILAKLARHIS